LKLNYFLATLVVLVFGSSYMASANDAFSLNNSLALDSELADNQQKNTMTWPMLPGESVNDLARMFYPNSKTMQQQFVAKTLRLNADTQVKASQRFESPTLLVIPTLKSLSKNAAKVSKKSNKSLKMSYGLKRVIQLAPEKLQQEYEELVSKNAFLKEQLVKLNEKIIFLQGKLEDLKLIFDKTLTLPTSDLPIADPIATNTIPAQASEPVVSTATTEQTTEKAAVQTPEPASSQPAAKKVFKNLNNVDKPETVPKVTPAETSFLDSLNMELVKVALAIAALLLLGAFALKKYRERMFAQLSFASTKIQNTVTDFSGYIDKPKAEKTEPGPETIQHRQAAQEIETRLSATLEEAKLLMSVNRGTDAIAHLKMTIESQPKAAINHWLYLLEVFRKLNLKDEFEQYADSLHETFNVMTPIWYEKLAETTALVVPQSLEEFPHIMEQLYGVWPGELASVYLRSLITDNRGGERVGFGKAVVGEILFLIELLDTYKDIPN
jgi:hypothetical protein